MATSAPDHLTDDAKAEWQRLAEDLANQGLLHLVDQDQFAIYCQARAQWVEAEESLSRYGTIILGGPDKKTPAPSPYLTIANRAISQMAGARARLGINPSALTLPEPRPQPKPPQRPPSRRFVEAMRRRQALELRLAGYTYAEIATSMGVSSKANVWHMVEKGLAESLREPSEAVRNLEIERLDSMLKGIWPRAITADVQAIGKVLQLMERRAKLLGLDPPSRIDVRSMVDRWAADAGLDPEEVVIAAEELVRSGQV